MLQASGLSGASSAARASRATRNWRATSGYIRDCGPTHAQCAASASGVRTIWRNTYERTKWGFLPWSPSCCRPSCTRASRGILSNCRLTVQNVICFKMNETCLRPSGVPRAACCKLWHLLCKRKPWPNVSYLHVQSYTYVILYF
jgi:hypothetical protein